MPFQGGPRAIAEMLSKMTMAERKRLLGELRLRDPETCKLIENEMVQFEDLKTLTVKMLQDLLKKVSLDDLALALRLGSPELGAHIRGLLSTRLAKDLDDVLRGSPRPVDQVEVALSRVMDVVRQMVERGELVLGDDETLV
jgi:flagellar motor switch protein FliG